MSNIRRIRIRAASKPWLSHNWHSSATITTSIPRRTASGLLVKGRSVTKPYDSKRLPTPKSGGGRIKSYWDNTKMRYHFNGNDEVLQKIVKDCKLKDRANQPIESADPTDRRDAFFNHRELRPTIFHDDISLDITNPKHLAIWKMFEGRPNATDDENDQDPNIKYELIDLSKKLKENSVKVNHKMNAFVAMSTVAQSKLVTIGNYLGAQLDQSSTQDVVNSAISLIIERDPQSFLEALEIPDEFLYIQDYVTKGIKKGLLRKKKGNYVFMDLPVGRSLKQVFEYFNNSDNADMLDQLEIKLEV